jgi:glycosyltransferase involved in cell wall biosynthesis
MIFKFIAILFLWAYSGVLLYAVIGFVKTRFFSCNLHHKNYTKTTIVVCARNEEQNITACLQSISIQNFDKSLLQIVFINDASEDKTLALAEKQLSLSGIRYELINNIEKEGKKRSITSAIQKSTGDLIIVRDADTFTESPLWLKTIVDFHEFTKKEFIIAPVHYQNKNGMLNQLQFFENSALNIITGGFAYFQKAFLCSGGNLAFTKALFYDCNGYSSHLQTASGDDVLFMEDVKKLKPDTIAYLKQKEASVMTYPVKTALNLLYQKIRWASKFDQNHNKTNTFIGILVVFVHSFSIILIFRPILSHHIPVFGAFFILSRFLIDYLLLFLASRYFNISVKWLWLLPVSLFYSFYVVITAVLSLIIKPKWK